MSKNNLYKMALLAVIGTTYSSGADICENRRLALENTRTKEENYTLGMKYKNPKNSQHNVNHALYYLTLAADENHVAAQYHLAMIYKKLEYSDQAFKYLDLSAYFCGHKLACYQLGLIYLRGDGQDQNFGKALECFKFAAEQGHVGAQYYLGKMYANGQGVGRSRKKASEHWKACADSGHKSSQACLDLE